MVEHFPFRPEEANLQDSESLSPSKNIFCFLEPYRTLFYYLTGRCHLWKKLFSEIKCMLLYLLDGYGITTKQCLRQF